MQTERDPRIFAIPDIHGHAKGEHKPYAEERPLPLTARMLFLWFYHACRRGYPRFLMVADHMNYLTFEDPAAVNLVRRALKLAEAGDLYGAAETANVEVGHAQVVSEGLRRGMRYSIGAEVDNDPRARPDAQNIVDAMRPDGLVRSVHFIPIDHPTHGPNWNWPFDNPEFAGLFEHVGTEKTWELYVGALIDAIERLPGHIVGHFYVPAVFGHWPDEATLEQYEDRMLAAAGERGMAVEFNTRFLYREHSDEERERYLAANRRLMRKAKERGVGIAVGSDAHSPKDQGHAFEVVLGVLDELDINELVFPIGGRLLRVALRVVRAPEPEPEPEPPPTVAETSAAAPVRAASGSESVAVEPAPEPARPRKARTPRAPRSRETAPAAPAAETYASDVPAEPAPAAPAAPIAPAAAAPGPVALAAPEPVAALSAPEPPPARPAPRAEPAPARKKAAAPPRAVKAAPRAPARPAARPAAKKAAPGARKAAAKKAPPKKVAVPVKKTAAKKAPAKKAAPAKKTVAKKAARVVAKRAPAKKAAPARKAAAKKSPAKKTAAKRR